MNVVEEYIKNRYDFDEEDVDRIVGFYEEHLENSHQLSDLCELVEKVAKPD